MLEFICNLVLEKCVCRSSKVLIMERSIRECVKLAGNEGYANRIDIMRQHVQKVVDNPLIDKEIRSVLDDVTWVLETLSEDIKKKRVG